MEQTREERMRQRMRGAARHQVEDADFGDLFELAIPAPEPQPEPETESSDPGPEPPQDPAPAPAPVTRIGPNTSAKRRRLNSEGPNVPVQGQAQQPSLAKSNPANRSTRRALRPSARTDPYDIENAPSTVDGDTSRDTDVDGAVGGDNVVEKEAIAAPTSRASTIRAAKASPGLPPFKEAPLRASPSKSVERQEVSSSPADEPDSGRRRGVRASGAVTSSALLQSALRSEENDSRQEFPQSSSPLSRKSRKSATSTVASAKSTWPNVRRSQRLSSSSGDEVNELSFDLPSVAEDSVKAGVQTEEGLEEGESGAANTIKHNSLVAPAEEPEEAEEIDDKEAASRLGRKRPRRTEPAPSPDLSPGSPEPVAKRPRQEARPKKKQKKSPAQQRQPKAPRPKQKKIAARKGKDEEAGAAVPIKTQRFTKPPLRDDDGSGDEDPLHSAIPYASRREVNAVDVLAGICEQMIEKSLRRIAEAIRETHDVAGKKELRVKMLALEMFDEEIRTRLLGHAIVLDDVYALKRRVRDAQKAKLKLRERIIQLRTEREQVQLRMDAVRRKHNEDSKEAMHNINLSAAMHDVDLAVEQGRAAPELSAKKQKMAELANLELLISQVADQVCSSGPGGGALKQIRSFNAFLERAAAVL